MICEKLLTLTLVITLALISKAPAQTTDPYLNELLRQTDELLQDSHPNLNEPPSPEKQQLYKNCRNREACHEYNQSSQDNQQGNNNESRFPNSSQNSHY